ncbi:hypothetical protein F3Y22_tig00116984pilonHSYRG00290 [Hibiscus syriacus]|uniref:Uncharacterized protein n=1 Tax=Hibiscus syriacus TaxID=106335 RepID=A0A6A2WG48_HIBSY|nr:hypothetical protein F3Y22_tig00116984pilonHSYRG00290 [Hibiscus syriacus]
MVMMFFPGLNLKVLTYKELNGVTPGLSVARWIRSGLWNALSPISPFEIMELHPAPTSLIIEGRCNYGINSFTNIFAGHIGDIELLVVAIALSVVANFSFGFMLGMASTLETLCGQAFGAGQIEIDVRHIHAAVMDNLIWGMFRVVVTLLICHTTLETPQTRARNRRSGRRFYHASSTSNVLISHQFPNPKVPAGTKQGAAVAYDISAWLVALAQLVYVGRSVGTRKLMNSSLLILIQA